MTHPDRGFLYAFGFTAGLTLLVAAAVGPEFAWLGLAVLLANAGSFAFFYLLFPGSRAFAVGLANGLAAYACLFVYFLEANFAAVSEVARSVGFLLPVLGFLAGTALRRRTIEGIVTARQPRATAHPHRIFLWLLPVGAVGIATFFVPALDLGDEGHDLVFLGAMLAIGATVALLSANIAVFLLDSALLFEQLFRRLGRLVTAAFAFLTFYSLLVIAFGAIYRLLDVVSTKPQFLIGGVARDLAFSEALYFSLVTLATLGYGDVVPAAAAARILVAIQTVIGLLLLLFGFAEIQRALRERGDR